MIRLFAKKPQKPTHAEIWDYVLNAKVNYPGWLTWYYRDHLDEFPSPAADDLARDLKMEPLK